MSRLSANLIQNYNGPNSFDFNNWSIRAGEANTLYFQLCDLDQKPWPVLPTPNWQGQAAGPNNLRYLPGLVNTPVVVTVTFPTINNNPALILTATAVNAADASLYSVSLTNLQIPGSGNVIFSVTEGTATRNFLIVDGISVENPLQSGSC